MNDECVHVEQVRKVEPRTPEECEECLQSNSQWVQAK
jgi:hypothetical protein